MGRTGKVLSAICIGHAKSWLRSTIAVWLADGCPIRRDRMVASLRPELICNHAHSLAVGDGVTSVTSIAEATSVIQPVGLTPLLDFPRVWETYRFILSSKLVSGTFDAEHDDLIAAYLLRAGTHGTIRRCADGG